MPDSKSTWKRLPNLVLALVGALALAGLTLVPPAPTAQAAEVKTTLAPVVATYTKSTAKTKNYASSTYLYVSKSRYHTYLQFDLSNIDLSKVTRARLQLTTKSRSGNRRVVVRAADSSDALTITPSTAPAVGSRIGLSGNIKSGARTTVSLTDMSVLKSTTVLALTLLKSGTARFYKSGSRAPALIITTAEDVDAAGDPDPSPTATATSPSTPSTGSRREAGSAAVGSATYPVPAGAVFVSSDGSSSGTGTLTNPYASVQTAMSKAASGTTIVLRGGTYHESIEVPFYKRLVIQSYPNEAVWFDGASTITDWRASGSAWYTPWDYAFDHKVSFTTGQDQTSWWVDPAYPAAGYPEQVWINGVAQTQVTSASKVAAGKFFVDTSAKRLILGSNPSGKKIEASTLQKAITVHGAGSTLRGFGVRRYATTVCQFGAVSVEVSSVTLENMVIRENSTIGIYSWGNSATFKNITVNNNGLMGIGIGKSSGLLVENSDVSFNNSERFNEEPVAGGLKVQRVSDSKFLNNLIEGNVDSNGLWFDVGSSNNLVAGNSFIKNGTDGLEVEISDTFWIVNNQSIGNGWSGMRFFDSSYIEAWNNTVVANSRWSFRIMQDDGRADQWGTPYITNTVNLRNNVVAFANSSCPMVVLDSTNKRTGEQMKVSLKGNAYHRASASAPSTFMCWAAGSSGLTQYTSLASFSKATGQDSQSLAFEGTSILDSNYALTSSVVSSVAAVPVGVPQTVAGLMDVSTGWKGVGSTESPIAR